MLAPPPSSLIEPQHLRILRAQCWVGPTEELEQSAPSEEGLRKEGLEVTVIPPPSGAPKCFFQEKATGSAF